MTIKKQALIKSFGAILILVLVQILIQVLEAALSVLLAAPICNIIGSFLAIGLTFYLIQLTYRHVFKEKISPLISPFKIESKWLIISLILPLGVIASFLLMPGKGSWQHFSLQQLSQLLTAAIFYVGMATGIIEEAIFRGILLPELEKGYGRPLAIWAPSLLFASLHIIGRHLNWQSILLLLIAGSLVGVMFSLITLASHSFWNSAFVHGFWNIIIIGNIIHIGSKNDSYAWFNYLLETKNLFLTGGDFGIEASLIAILGYGIVSLLALFDLKKAKARQ